jgi:hypothetical protein
MPSCPEEEHAMMDLRYPEWQTASFSAMRELDDTKLVAKAKESEAAIFLRLQALGTNSDHY